MNKEIEELAERSKDDRALIAGSEVRWVCGTALALLADNDLLTLKINQSEKRRMEAERILREKLDIIRELHESNELQAFSQNETEALKEAMK